MNRHQHVLSSCRTSSDIVLMLSVSPVTITAYRKFVGAASLIAMLTLACLANFAGAQTVIYDGSQQLNFFSASHLTDTLMLTNNPADPTRNGVVNSGADPNVLEPGDAAWFRSTGRRMSNLNGVGLAGSAVGVDGDFMSDSGAVNGQQGAGVFYVLYVSKATTGFQNLYISVYYNDPSPNSPGAANDMGGSVAVRVYGVQSAPNGDPNDPWGDDEFTHLASTGFAAAFISAANHRPNGTAGVEPVVDLLLWYDSSYDVNRPVGNDILPSDEWQDLSFPFDAGTGYDWLIFAVGGVGQADLLLPNVPADRYGFDNISFEPAPGIPGDFDGDGDVDGADFLEWQRNDVTPAGLIDWQNNYGTPTLLAAVAVVPEPSSILLIILAAGGLLAEVRNRMND